MWLHFDSDLPTEVTEANPIPVGMMIPDIAGSLNLRHPDACQALMDAAVAAGAVVRRGVSEIEVRPSRSPMLACRVGADTEEISAALVVGADGRGSVVRGQAGIALERQPEPNMVAGVLLDGVKDMPAEADFIVSNDDAFMASFQQGGGRVRVYLCPGVSERHRFSGPGGLAEFLRSTAVKGLPFGEQLMRGEPAGPLATYPGDDSWATRPFAEGVVVVGDAAGWNNPIIGQGLSISLRDARTVRDVVRAGDLSAGAFAAYGTERLERMRRLRQAANFVAAAFGEDCDDRPARRARYFQMQQDDPLFMGLLVAIMAGPEVGPPEAFDGSLTARMRGRTAAA
jgi:2-polyprenyl-6-methoxyphenol hydroxylase-like FAD-dependent oxidoreductase